MFFLSPFILILGTWVLFLAGLGWIVGAGTRRAHRAQAALPTLVRMGFRVDGPTSFVPRFPFSEFANSNVRLGLRITRHSSVETAFQLQYPVGIGNNERTVLRSCAVVPIPFWAPELSISHGGAGVAGVLDPDRVESDSAAFNARFRVRSRNERFAYTTLSYEVVEWFLHAPPMMLETTVRMHGPWMMLIAPQFDERHLPQLLGLAETLRSQLPPVLKSLYPYPAPTPPH